ncbi:MAG TPA: amino acid permease [Vicinamibacterales bacterium]|nr:amino acid permease [Vicinamibacterales bacterium]
MAAPLTTPAAGAALPEEGLVRALGLRSGILFVLGSVIGSGIFLTTGTMASALPSPALILLAWAAGGVIALSAGLTYAEMAAMFPRSGGVYVYLREAFGPMVAFLYGWAALLIFFSGGIAAVAVGFADYLSYFAPSLSTARILWSAPTPLGTWTVSAAQIVAIVSIAALVAINYVGVRSGNAANVLLTIAKVLGLASLPVLALIAADVSPAWTPVVPSVPRPLAAFGVAMIAVLWANDAWYCITWIAGEMRDPRRDLPRALIIGISLLTAIYLIVNVAYLYTLPMAELQGVTRVAERAASVLAGTRGASFVALTVLVSTLGCNAAAVLAGARLLFAMARDGVFLPAAAAVHPRYRTPHVALVALGGWASLLALSGSYEQLFTYVMFASTLLHALGAFGVFRLRRLRPDVPRPYRVWGYPIVPIVYIAASGAVVLNTLIERPRESVAGLALLAVGLPVYWYSKKT